MKVHYNEKKIIIMHSLNFFFKQNVRHPFLKHCIHYQVKYVKAPVGFELTIQLLTLPIV